MPVTISFNNLANGQSIMLPYMVNGSLRAFPPPAGIQITAASYQINEGPLQPLTCVPALPTAQTNFSLALNGLQTNSWHILTIYVWDDQNSSATIASVTFRVISGSGGP